MNILIIGGTGILSAAVVDACISCGYNVTMLNRGRNVKFINSQAELLKCDIYDETMVKTMLDGRHFDVVIDFLIRLQPELEYSLKLLGNIADQYVFISSAQAYNTAVKGVLEEDSELVMPLWSYSVNKAKCEKFLIDYAQTNSINYTIIRPGVNYDDRRIPYGIFPPIGMHWTMVARILAGKPMITWNGGMNKLNLTRVEDFAVGMVGLLGKREAYNESFNVVGDYSYTWKDVLDTLGELLNTEVKTVDLPVDFYANELVGDDREALLGGRSQDLICSNEKMKKIVTSYVTKFDLKTGLAKTLAFYRENNYFNGIHYGWDGDTDRIINKYYKLVGHPKDRGLVFIPYLDENGDAFHLAKLKYDFTNRKDVFHVKLYRLAKEVFYRKPKNLLKKIIMFFGARN